MSSPAPCLQWKGTDDRPELFRIEASEIIIGRREDASLVLKHAEVSRRHARISQDPAGFELTDLGSMHGTYINGERINSQRLNPGDRIRFGLSGPDMLFGTGAVRSGDFDRIVEQLSVVMPVTGVVPTAIAKVSCLLDLQYSLGQNFSATDIFRHILKSVLGLSGAQRGFVLRRGRKGLAFTVGLEAKGNELFESDFSVSQSVIRRVMETSTAVFMTEGINSDLAAQASIVAQSLRAVACLPLRAMSQESGEMGTLGILYLDSRAHMHALTGLDQKILTKLAEEAGHAIEKLELVEGMEDRRKLDHDLALANEAQRSLLPRELPEFPPFEIHAFSRPTRHVGGDFYDFFPEGETLAGVLADVSGKGVAAALLGSMIQGALGAQFRVAVTPADALNAINGMVWQKTPASRYATVFLFQIGRDGEGEFVGAGHNPAYVYRAASGEIEELQSGGVPLGLFRDVRYEPIRFSLAPGDALVVYSDGLTEAENPDGDMFGEDRLQEIIRRDAAKGSVALTQSILSEVSLFAQDASPNDDLTYLLVYRNA